MTHRYYFQGANGHGHVRLKKNKKQKRLTPLHLKSFFFCLPTALKIKYKFHPPNLEKT